MSVIFEIVVWFALLVVLPALAYLRFDQGRNIWEKKKIPFRKRELFFGNFRDVVLIQKSINQVLGELYEHAKDSPYVGFYIFNRPAILIKDPEIIKHVLVKDFNNFVNRNFSVDKKIDPVGHNMMFVNVTDRWKNLRAKTSPIFTTSKIKFMFSLMLEIAEELTKKLETEVKDADGVNTAEMNAQYTTDVICSVVLGFKSDCLVNPESKLREFGRMAFSLTYGRAFEFMTTLVMPDVAALLRLKLIPPSMQEFLNGTFWQIFKHRQENKFSRNDLVDLFMQLKNKESPEKTGFSDYNMTDEEILSTVVTFFTAGFETTSSTMTYTMYELAKHQDAQDKLREEIQKAAADCDGKLTYEVIQQLKYLDCCVNEALRMHTILPFLDRKCTQDYKVPGQDLVIPAGTPVYISLDSLHFDKKYFPEPEKFDPERFSEDRKKDIVPYSYLPFGEGPRNCIGMRFGLINAKNGIFHVINKFKIEPCADTPRRLEYSEKSFLNISKHTIKLKFTPLS